MSVEKAVKLLRKILEKGQISVEELSEEELQILQQLEREGVVKKCYTISPEYINDIVKICKPRVIVLRESKGRKLIRNMLKIAIPLAISALPIYLAIYSAVIGYTSVFIFFMIVSALCMYGGLLLSKKIIEKIKLIKL